MARQGRIDAPGALHHIIIRGIERRAIFRDDGDREGFLERLETVLVDTPTPCYAWAFLLRFWAVRELGVSLTDLARRLGMSPAGVGYAVQRGEVMARELGYQLYPPLNWIGDVPDILTFFPEGLRRLRIAGAADKAASLMGWKSPVVNCPILTTSISGAR